MKCYQMPRFLMNNKFKCLCGTSKIMYAVMYTYFLHTIEQSEKDNEEGKEGKKFRDEKGFFIKTSVASLAYIMGVHDRTIYHRLGDLEKIGLIFRESLGEQIKIYLVYAKEPPKKN